MFRTLQSVDKKNKMNILVSRIVTGIGICEDHEIFNLNNLKPKVIFVAVHLIITLITILPTAFLYSSYSLSCVYISIIFCISIWRGGSYYVEVLREIHDIKLDKLNEKIKKQETVTDNEDQCEKGYNLLVTEGNTSVSEIYEECYFSDSGDMENGPDLEKSWEEISTNL